MTTFIEPLIIISKEEYDQLIECREVVMGIWREKGPYSLGSKFSWSLQLRLETLIISMMVSMIVNSMDEVKGDLETVAKQYAALINTIVNYFDIDRTRAASVISKLCSEIFVDD